MSSKVDTLLKKATTFERLALYSDRKSFLKALAQSGAPDVNAMIAGIENTRKSIVQAVVQFWTKNPQAMSIPARNAFSALRYPQTDIKSATGPELDSALDQLNTAANGVFRALNDSGSPEATNFAQTFYRLTETLDNQINKFKDSMESLPRPSGESAVSPQSAQQRTTSTGPAVNPKELFDIQNFLNHDLINEMAPITPDGKWGDETRNRILYWGSKKKLKLNLQQLIEVLKARAMGSNVASQIKGPSPEI